jgi:nicotinate-nucleotide pyrophosphorylase (carboxylating)
MDWQHPEITDAIRRALAEDIGAGDITTEACVPANATAQGHFLARAPMIVAGVELLRQIYDVERVDLLTKSGDVAGAGVVLAQVAGSARRLLTLERTALNFLQRLGGIATLARKFVDAVEGTGCEVLDTRKTTPGLRRLEKLAAHAGGVTNHRMGLYDAVLIKNNHITAAGSVTQALRNVASSGLPVEIEVRGFEELEQALVAGAKHLLLDNFTPGAAREAVAKIAGRAKIEISGGITLDNVRAYADTGADYVSAGAITHSARAVDISFRLEL